MKHFSFILASLVAADQELVELVQKIESLPADQSSEYLVLKSTSVYLQGCIDQEKNFSQCVQNVDIDQWIQELDQSRRPSTRSSNGVLPNTVPLSFSGIWNYGCWCNFGQNLMSGQGTPVNRMDQLCQDMQLCLRCAKSDAENFDQEDNCDPKTTTFKSNYGHLFFGKTVAAACNLNESTCSRNVCMCQTNMIAQMIQLVFEGYQHDREYYEDVFTEEIKSQVCQKSGKHGGDENETACCGYYPERKPFLSGGRRRCCQNDQQLYNEMTHQCCVSYFHSGVIEAGEVC